jgi:TetR/AcrR family transcriptional repressor of bet genes
MSARPGWQYAHTLTVAVRAYCYPVRVPRVVDHRQRHREIAYAVWYVIATQGLDAVTLRAVAEEAGISVGRIQHYFTNKDAMIREACREMVTAAEEQYRALTDDKSSVEALEALILSPIPTSDRARVATSVWHTYLALSLSDPAIAVILRDAQHGQENETVRLLSLARDQGLLQPGPDLRSTARRLVALVDGLSERVLVGAVDSSAAVQLLLSELARLADQNVADSVDKQGIPP